MRIRKLENISNEDVELWHKNGAKTILPPGAELKDIDVVNLDEIKGKTKTTIDLTEVNEASGRKRLDS